MNALFGAAAAIQSFCESRGWGSAIIGGLAVQRWGEPRQTRDVDLTIVTGFGGEERFVDPLLACSAEDLVVLKAFAGRVQDWMDIEGVVVRQGALLDRPLVAEELEPLLELKDDVESRTRLETIFTKHTARP